MSEQSEQSAQAIDHSKNGASVRKPLHIGIILHDTRWQQWISYLIDSLNQDIRFQVLVLFEGTAEQTKPLENASQNRSAIQRRLDKISHLVMSQPKGSGGLFRLLFSLWDERNHGSHRDAQIIQHQSTLSSDIAQIHIPETASPQFWRDLVTQHQLNLLLEPESPNRNRHQNLGLSLGHWSIQFNYGYPISLYCPVLSKTPVSHTDLLMDIGLTTGPLHLLSLDIATHFQSPWQNESRWLYHATGMIIQKLRSAAQIDTAEFINAHSDATLSDNTQRPTVPSVERLTWYSRMMGFFLANQRVQRNRRHHYEHWSLWIGHEERIPDDLSQFSEIMPPAGHFWADPFVIEKHGVHHLFFEDYDYATKKGVISYIQLEKKSIEHSTPITVMESEHHLSFPFLFNHNNALHMVPECSASGRIELYRCTHFPNEWTLQRVLMDNVSAADTVLFFHESRWWLFTNLEVYPDAYHQDGLFIYHADDLMYGTWQAHPANPVVSDVRFARGAGSIFEQDGTLYRPSQDNSETYGGALNIQKIIELSPTRYREQHVKRFAPDWHVGLAGVHTYNQAGGLTVIDSKQYKKNKAPV
ncbi:MAG: hypothetical protein HQL54_12125 [Magnetococcales bacterium]|nr:hypothetical protein [Magnetococcales bacterium]